MEPPARESLSGDGRFVAYRGLLEQVSDRIRARIFSGALKDGERIVERNLAAEMGTSRGPIRDALRVLEQEGLVISAPRRGTRVASLTRANAIEILAIREALEPVAVRFLIEQRDPRHFTRLADVVERLDVAARENDWPEAIRLDLEFHGLIFELSGQRRLLRIWESFKTPMFQLFGKLSNHYAAIEEVPARHRALLESIGSGNLERALRHSSEHVVAFEESLLANLQNESSLDPSS